MSAPRLAGWGAALLLFTAPGDANAYMGPGLGLGLISVALGFIGSIILGFFAVLWYPVKRFLRRRRQAKATSTSTSTPTPTPTESEETGE